MQVGPLSLFTRRHSNGTPINSWLLAGWHWRWSITWRWILVLNLRHGKFAYCWGTRARGAIHLCPLTFEWQANMPRKQSR